MNKLADFTKVSGSPLVELQIGKGRIAAGEMLLLETAPHNPVARKLLGKLIQMLSADSCGFANREGHSCNE